MDDCEQAMTDEAIVAAVQGDQEEAVLESVRNEDDINIPDFLCKDTLDYLNKLKVLCTANNLSEEALKHLSDVEDEVVSKAVKKQRQSKITVFFHLERELKASLESDLCVVCFT